MERIFDFIDATGTIRKDAPRFRVVEGEMIRSLYLSGGDDRPECRRRRGSSGDRRRAGQDRCGRCASQDNQGFRQGCGFLNHRSRNNQSSGK